MYSYKDELGAENKEVIAPIDPGSSDVLVWSKFWESDLHEDDVFGRTAEVIYRDYQSWPAVNEVITIQAPVMGDTADLTLKVRIRGFEYPGP